MVIQKCFPAKDTVELGLEEFRFELEQFTCKPYSLATLPLEMIYTTFSALQKKLLKRDDPLHLLYKEKGLSFLVHFLSPCNLKKLLCLALHNDKILDEMTEIAGTCCLATPRGTVGHWLAGNIPLLSIISVIQALLTKNRSVVKLSSKQEDFLSPFLHTLAQIAPAGQILSQAVQVYSYKGEDMEANQMMSKFCDVRMAWGSKDAVQAVQNLLTKEISTPTIVLGPKVSVAVIDPSIMTSLQYQMLAQDCLLFHQLACSSPHSILVKGDESMMQQAAEGLSVALSKIQDSPLFGSMQPFECSQVINYRTTQWMQEQPLHVSTGTQWTLHLHKELSALQAHGFCIVHLYAIENFAQAVPFLPDSLQTVAYCLTRSDLKQLVADWKSSSACRFSMVGHTHDYTLPWDGMLLLDQLVKWIYVEEGTL